MSMYFTEYPSLTLLTYFSGPAWNKRWCLPKCSLCTGQ